MKLYTRVALGVLAVGGTLLLPVAVAEAHDCCHGRHGCPMAGAQAVVPGGSGGTGPAYDPDTVTAMRGTIGSVSVVPARGGRMGGMHVTLQSDGPTLDVHLGPTWFLQQEGFELAKGDSVEVTGSVVEVDGSRFLIAREIKTAQKALKLRDEQGIPVWSGGRRRP